MKRYFTSYFMGFIITIFFIAQVNAQISWTKCSQNPVLGPGILDSWDDRWVAYPMVIHDGTQFIMYYTGWPDLSPFGTKIGRATSPDGISWTKENANPVIKVGLAGQWDDASVLTGPVIFDGTGYKMWYCGVDGSIYRSGLATSDDGIDWTKYAGNPVLDIGESGQWDDNMVIISSVVFEGSIYKAWYCGRKSSTGIWRVGYATSADGIKWDKYVGNPVLDVGDSGEWDGTDIEIVSVLHNNDIYEMWYGASDDSVKRSGYATSPDGIDWTKDTLHNPILVPESSWESNGTEVSTVLLRDTTYIMWYSGESNSSGKIGYATAPKITGIEDKNQGNVIQNFKLLQNYPNPFNPKTVISYHLPTSSEIDLSIFNILGEKVVTVVSEKQRAGYHEIEFNGQNLVSGLYLYKIEAGTWQDVKKMVLLK